MLWIPFPMLRTLFPCCAPSLLPWHSVHVTSDVTSLWRTCCELVASMWRPTSKHSVANTFSMLRTLFPCCEQLFPCCEHFFHVAPLPPPPT
jgi:hypothetical protein